MLWRLVKLGIFIVGAAVVLNAAGDAVERLDSASSPTGLFAAGDEDVEPVKRSVSERRWQWMLDDLPETGKVTQAALQDRLADEMGDIVVAEAHAEFRVRNQGDASVDIGKETVSFYLRGTKVGTTEVELGTVPAGEDRATTVRFRFQLSDLLEYVDMSEEELVKAMFLRGFTPDWSADLGSTGG